MVAFMRAEGQTVETFELESGHCANLTATKEVVEVVTKIIDGLE